MELVDDFECFSCAGPPQSAATCCPTRIVSAGPVFKACGASLHCRRWRPNPRGLVGQPGARL